MNPEGGNEEFQYTPSSGMGNPGGLQSAEASPQQSTEALISWQASEFIEHRKSYLWYVYLALGAAIIAIIIFFITKSIISSVVVILAFATLGLTARQKPRTLSYTLLTESIKIGDKGYGYDDFKSFSVDTGGALPSISLQPIKRTMPPLTIYFDSTDGDKIFEKLALHLPFEEGKKDSAIDQLMKKVRF